MRRGTLFLLLAFFLVVAVGAIYYVYTTYMAPPDGEQTAVEITPTPVLTGDVVMLVQPVGQGEAIREEMVQVAQYPLEFITANMVKSVDEVLGMRAKYALEPPMPVTQNLLIQSEEDFLRSGSDDALLIPRGMVSVSIPIDRLSSVSYAPERGDHVNVIVTLLMADLDSDYQTRLPNLTSDVLSAFFAAEGRGSVTNLTSPGTGPVGRSALDPAFDSPFYIVPSEEQRPRMVSQTLIQDVIVLQMGDFPLVEVVVTPTPAPVEDTGEPTPVPTPTAPPPPPDVITLIVSPQDAVTLNYLIYSGAKLTLVMRNPLDDQRITTEAVTLQFLLDQYQIPVPAKLPFGMEPRVNSFNPVLSGATPTPQP